MSYWLNRVDKPLDSEEIKERFRKDPKFYLAYCKAIESELNVRFRLVMNGTPEAKRAKEVRIETRRMLELYRVHQR
jgi:hypothetical protein